MNSRKRNSLVRHKSEVNTEIERYKGQNRLKRVRELRGKSTLRKWWVDYFVYVFVGVGFGLIGLNTQGMDEKVCLAAIWICILSKIIV